MPMFYPPDLPKLYAQVEALRVAKTSGILTVDYPERGRVTYRDFNDILRAERSLIDYIATIESDGAPVRTRRVVLTSQSGF